MIRAINQSRTLARRIRSLPRSSYAIMDQHTSEKKCYLYEMFSTNKGYMEAEAAVTSNDRRRAS